MRTRMRESQDQDEERIFDILEVLADHSFEPDECSVFYTKDKVLTAQVHRKKKGWSYRLTWSEESEVTIEMDMTQRILDADDIIYLEDDITALGFVTEYFDRM